MIAAIWKNDLRHWLIWINFVAFGGLIASQLLTLYTTPVVYLYLDGCRLWFERRRQNWRDRWRAEAARQW